MVHPGSDPGKAMTPKQAVKKANRVLVQVAGSYNLYVGISKPNARWLLDNAGGCELVFHQGLLWVTFDPDTDRQIVRGPTEYETNYFRLGTDGIL